MYIVSLLKHKASIIGYFLNILASLELYQLEEAADHHNNFFYALQTGIKSCNAYNVFLFFFSKEQPSSSSSSDAMQFTCVAQYWEVKPTSLNSLANEPGVEIFLKGFDLKQLNITAAQHVQRSCICTVQK